MPRKLEPGEVVIISADHLASGYRPLEQDERVFVCEAGTGLDKSPLDRDGDIFIFGHWLDGYGYDRIARYWIDDDETATWQEEHGRFVHEQRPPKRTYVFHVTAQVAGDPEVMAGILRRALKVVPAFYGAAVDWVPF